ncbi:MAG: PH domain-containing protein [Planctomycetota bacterium]
MNYESHSAAWIRVRGLVASIVYSMLMVGAGVAVAVLGFLHVLAVETTMLSLLLVVSVGIGARLLEGRWIRLDYQRSSFALTLVGLEIQRGVLWRSVLKVPRNRIQYTDLSRGPLERRYQLATLIVHTAGTVHAVVTLPGLEVQRAQALRDALLMAPESTAGAVDDAV